MKLIEWLDKHKININKFCQLSGLCYSSIYQYIKQGKALSNDYAIKIENFTKGEVSRIDVLWPDYAMKIKENKNHD